MAERERELRKERIELPSRIRSREGPVGVRITLGQPTIRFMARNIHIGVAMTRRLYCFHDTLVVF